jgi:penicillin-binding protein-related factor A (putative recombinase)
MTTSPTNRGKVAEKLIKKQLDKLSSQSSLMYMRLPDAHAGNFQPTVADFLLTHKGRTVLLEVKEVAFDNRMPYKNFSPDQVARMRRWELAGALPWVIIYHSSLNIWRSPDFSTFLTRPPEKGSWDFSNFKKFENTEFMGDFICQENLKCQ